MKNFRQDKDSSRRSDKRFPSQNGFGGRNSGRGFGSDRDLRSSSMHKAICAECGENCEVPFRPTGDKPVYCSNCFKNMRGESSRRPSGGDNRRSSDDRKMFSAICSACGKTCEVPFRPTGEKPVYCSNCFENNRGSSSDRGDGNKKIIEQFNILNAKLDKIIKILAPDAIKELAPEKKDVKKEATADDLKESRSKEVVKEKSTTPLKALSKTKGKNDKIKNKKKDSIKKVVNKKKK